MLKSALVLIAQTKRMWCVLLCIFILAACTDKHSQEEYKNFVLGGFAPDGSKLALSYCTTQSVYDGLLLQTRLKPYVDAISLTLDESVITMDFTATALAFQARFDVESDEAIRDLLDLQRISGADLNGMGWDGYGQLRDWLASAAPTTQSALIPALADFGYPGLRTQGDGSYGSEVDTVFCMVDIAIADDAYQQKTA